VLVRTCLLRLYRGRRANFFQISHSFALGRRESVFRSVSQSFITMFACHGDLWSFYEQDDEGAQPSDENESKTTEEEPVDSTRDRPLLKRHPALRLRLPKTMFRDDTMFVCRPCGKTFNSHAPLADQVQSKGHRRHVKQKETTDEQDFYCTCCIETLSPAQLRQHIVERHADISQRKVLHWYRNQPYGLPFDEQTIIGRHRRGIEKLRAALDSMNSSLP